MTVLEALAILEAAVLECKKRNINTPEVSLSKRSSSSFNDMIAYASQEDVEAMLEVLHHAERVAGERVAKTP